MIDLLNNYDEVKYINFFKILKEILIIASVKIFIVILYLDRVTEMRISKISAYEKAI